MKYLFLVIVEYSLWSLLFILAVAAIIAVVATFRKSLMKEKQQREQILSSIPVAIVTENHETNEIEVNKMAKEMLGMEEADIKARVRKSIIPTENKSFWQMLSSLEYFTTRKTSLTTNKKSYQILVSQSPLNNEAGEIVGRIFYFLDITEAERMEQRIHRSEKLAVLGELAAGAAHEIRNPLAVIDGFIHLMYGSLKDDDRHKFQLSLLIEELGRINHIIERMLMLAKPEAPKMKINSLKEVLDSIMPLIRANCPAGIDIRVQVDDFQTQMDREQMKQVFYNLIRNSIEALDEQGHIHIYSQIENNYVHVYIKDNGQGIDKELQHHIFDPFISNKEFGTGLGLSIIQRIIVNHKGEIELVNSNGEQTLFKMTLPIVQ